jgi:hypothetical protein
MLIITREMLARHLFELPRIAEAYAANDSAAIERILAWLTAVEETLARLRHPGAGFASVQRTKVMAAKGGFRDDGVDYGQMNRRQIERATAVVAMARVEVVLREEVQNSDARIAEYKEKMAQFLAVASATAPLSLPSGSDRADSLRAFWSNVAVGGEATGMYKYLSASLKQSDLVVILGDVIDNLISHSPASGAPSEHT